MEILPRTVIPLVGGANVIGQPRTHQAQYYINSNTSQPREKFPKAETRRCFPCSCSGHI